jgi:hypothetical protein
MFFDLRRQLSIHQNDVRIPLVILPIKPFGKRAGGEDTPVWES